MSYQMKLTKAAIAAAKSDKDTILWDAALTGFGLRVQPSGSKTFIIQYRLPSRKQRKLSIGSAIILDLDEARRIARAKLAAIAEGHDPAIGDKQAMTMDNLYARYRADYSKAYNKASTQARVHHWWLHIQPVFGHRLVWEIKRAEVVAFHSRLASQPATANKCVTLLSKLFNLANEWEWLTDGSNPARKIKKYRETHRTRILSQDEISRVLKACDEDWVYPPFATLLRLLLLTGCRVSEIAASKTEWIDWQSKVLRLPDSKSGPRAIPLSSVALELLKEVRTEWIIPSPDLSRPLVKTAGYWGRFRKRVGLEDVRLHDLRHTVGSYAHAAGMSQREIADLLGHKQLATSARYMNSIHGQTQKNVEALPNILGL